MSTKISFYTKNIDMYCITRVMRGISKKYNTKSHGKVLEIMAKIVAQELYKPTININKG